MSFIERFIYSWKSARNNKDIQKFIAGNPVLYTFAFDCRVPFHYSDTQANIVLYTNKHKEEWWNIVIFKHG